jgi:hypothetical protein
MSIVGESIQRNGHGKCGLPFRSFITNHFAELPAASVLGVVNPLSSLHRIRRHLGDGHR